MKHHSNSLNNFPKRLDKLKRLFISFKLSNRTIFILMGIVSTIWFLIRVIPKPQRAFYPCMRAAAPIMSGFIIYILTLGGSIVFFRKSLSKFRETHYKKALFLGALALVLMVAFAVKDARIAFANTAQNNIGGAPYTWRGTFPDGSNNPMGRGWGIYPGRVVWVMNKNATNEDAAENTMADAFFLAKNNNQDTINKMADNGIKLVGGAKTVKSSWDAIFKSFNKRKNGTASSYVSTQTIFIKINNGQAGNSINSSDLSQITPYTDTTPATTLAIVRQLVDSCGVPQAKIYIGEPMTHVYKSTADLILAKYPNVRILDKEDHETLGRTTTMGWTMGAIVYSDKGKIMGDAVNDDIMNEMYNADYQVNIAALKAHARNGVSLCSKLYVGAHNTHDTYNWGSFYLHAGMLSITDNDKIDDKAARTTYKSYRLMTDFMGHKKLGRNCVLFVVDGLWSGTEATAFAVKWKTAPFNNDWPNSLFMSQDEVAIESVCIDMLRSEANANTAFNDRPFFPAIDDYLHQAADSSNWPVDATKWPTGFKYDPEGDGTPMPGSLGVHEHWNNDTQKQYSKNLSPNGKGIDLVSYPSNLVAHNVLTNTISTINYTYNVNVYPNPCSNRATLSYQLTENAFVCIDLFAINGKVVKHIKQTQLSAGRYSDNINVNDLRSGIYFCRIAINNEVKTIKMEVK